MKVEQQNNLKFLGVDILHVNMSIQQSCEGDELAEIKINSNPTYSFSPGDDSTFFIVNEISINLKNYFSIELTALGTFQLPEKISAPIINDYIQVNAPAIMFPYIRSFISTLTVNSGKMMPTLTITPMLFRGIIEEPIPKNKPQELCVTTEATNTGKMRR